MSSCKNIGRQKHWDSLQAFAQQFRLASALLRRHSCMYIRHSCTYTRHSCTYTRHSGLTLAVIPDLIRNPVVYGGDPDFRQDDK